jgi:hypothetical protein
MVCLALAGSITAGAHYYTIDIPQQNAMQAPENSESSAINCAICKKNCKADPDYYTCLDQCNLVC